MVESETYRRPAGLDGGPLFTEPVPRNGYLWWYIDALSDDGQHGLTIIAFIGSVFSPYYVSARARAGLAGADPLQHCSINVALYQGVGPGPNGAGKQGHWWAMTERAARHVGVTSNLFAVGPSSLHWKDGQLVIEIDEWTVPFPSRIRGTVTVTPQAIHTESYALDSAGQHHWRPISPTSRVVVELKNPGFHWHGHAYFDSNHGAAPLESAFSSWDWSRGKFVSKDQALASNDPTLVVYDIRRVDGTHLNLAKQFCVDAAGRAITTDFVAPRLHALPRTGWWIDRAAACEAGHECRVMSTAEDTPFYARSVVSTKLCGGETLAFHESLSLQRFSRRWVQTLLPFKMPRRG
jgi:carotenoid 1,2-hydratase